MRPHTYIIHQILLHLALSAAAARKNFKKGLEALKFGKVVILGCLSVMIAIVRG